MDEGDVKEALHLASDTAVPGPHPKVTRRALSPSGADIDRLNGIWPSANNRGLLSVCGPATNFFLLLFRFQ